MTPPSEDWAESSPVIAARATHHRGPGAYKRNQGALGVEARLPIRGFCHHI